MGVLNMHAWPPGRPGVFGVAAIVAGSTLGPQVSGYLVVAVATMRRAMSATLSPVCSATPARSAKA